MKIVNLIAKILVIVGGVNWGLVGIGMFASSNLNVVNLLLGSWPMVEAVVYILVGISAVIAIFSKGCSCCGTSASAPQA